MKLNPKILLNTVMKHLRIQHLFNNLKITAAVTSTQKIQIFEIQDPKNTPLITVCKYAKSTPWAFAMIIDANDGSKAFN